MPIYFRPHRTYSAEMRSIVTDGVAWSVGLYVGQSNAPVNPAKTAEPTEMLFGLRSWVGPWNHILDGGPVALMWRGNYEGRQGRIIVKYGNTAVVYTKMAEVIGMPFGLRTRVQIPMERDNFGKRSSHCKYRDLLPWAEQERLNWSICRLDCGLAWAEASESSIIFARWRQCALGTTEPSMCSGYAACCQINLVIWFDLLTVWHVGPAKKAPHLWHVWLHIFAIPEPINMHHFATLQRRCGLYIGCNDVTYLWSQYDRHFWDNTVVLCIFRLLTGEDLSRFANKIESVGLRKCRISALLLESDIRIRNISHSLPHKRAQNSWHRYDMKKLRHCDPMYYIDQIYSKVAPPCNKVSNPITQYFVFEIKRGQCIRLLT